MREFEQIIKYVIGELTASQVDQIWARILADPDRLRLLELVAASRQLPSEE